MILPEQIYGIITKKRFNRDNPYLQKELKKRISSFALNKKPIKLVGFWGVGIKKETNWADDDTCFYLSKLNEEVKKIYKPGVEFTFILSDNHGIHNGIDNKSMNTYINSMKELFKKFNFHYIYLSQLWDKYDISFQKINELLEKKPKNWWEKFPNAKKLEELANVINHKYPAKEAAQKYVIMRILEKNSLEKEFKDSIFHTFSGPTFESLLPEMPRLYFYSYKRGRSNSPWFITSKK